MNYKSNIFLKFVGLVVVVFGMGGTVSYAVDHARWDVRNGIGVPVPDVKSDERNLSDFDRVDISGSVFASITAGQTFKVVVKAEQRILNKVITRVKDRTLLVKFEKSWWQRLVGKNIPVNVVISLPEISVLDVSGASRANLINVKNERLTIGLSGASSATVTGSARNVRANLSGASILAANDLIAEMAEMNLSGASDATVNIARLLRVEASGASSVRFTGEPRVEMRTSGSSSVGRQ